ncbi:MAG: hypothetical protein AAGJ96_05470 [Pseudomonadota bacterium]
MTVTFLENASAPGEEHGLIATSERAEIDRLLAEDDVIALEVIDRDGEVVEQHGPWDGNAPVFASIFDSARGIATLMGERAESTALMLSLARHKIIGLSLEQVDLIVIKALPRKQEARLKNVR